LLIAEILNWKNHPAEGNRPDPHLDFPPGPFDNDPTNLANAFTRSGLVKHFWNFQGSGGQPYRPAPPNAETELIPSGTLEPITSGQAEPIEEEPPVGQHRLVPFRPYRGVLGD
jgi:hypothetical protein